MTRSWRRRARSPSEGGIAAVQIAPVAERAGIAAGTVYRYFPSKTDLVAELVNALAQSEIAALSQAADAAPGPLSALAAAVATFGARALADRRLAFALDRRAGRSATSTMSRVKYRKALAGAFETRIRAAIAARPSARSGRGCGRTGIGRRADRGPDRAVGAAGRRRSGTAARRRAGAHAFCPCGGWVWWMRAPAAWSCRSRMTRRTRAIVARRRRAIARSRPRSSR